MAQKPRVKYEAVPVEAVVHRKDKRVNIPTEELREFVREDEEFPKKLLYPRDPSLDPQLVWKGKDEQDRQDLAIPAVPIYIQEKIHPRAIIEDLRQAAAEGKPRQADMFADFNGIQFEELIDFYRHEQNWSNRMILGDSLLVMTSLAEKEGLKGKVQMIYIDPPYGIKFGSNWQVSTRKRDVKDGRAEDATRQPEQIRAFRDTWKLGIHSYLSYLRDRLVAVRELLTETGSVFVQIGDENVHLVRCLLDEVFGSENFQRVITASKTSTASDDYLPIVADYVLWYSKNQEVVKTRMLFSEKVIGGIGGSALTHVLLPDGTERRLTDDEVNGAAQLPNGSRVFGTGDITSSKPPGSFPVEHFGRTYASGNRFWSTNEDGMRRLISAQRVKSSRNGLAYVRFQGDFPLYPVNNVWTDTVGQNQFGGSKLYVVQTALRIVSRCLLMSTDPGDLVLDPTCVRKGTGVWRVAGTAVGTAPSLALPVDG